MTTKDKGLMPEIGSRAHRVLVELGRHLAPVTETHLMAAHGMDGLPATVWRQGPYKLLATRGLAQQGDAGWQLTDVGRALIEEVETDMLQKQQHEPQPSVAAPRMNKPFKQMTSWPSRRPLREGALDYRNIPSLHSKPRDGKESA